MSYDLLFGYTGILSFGHAAFFGGGAYAMALWLTHAVPSIASRYRISLPGGANITIEILFIIGVLLVIVVSILLGLLFSAASARVKGVYFAMVSLAVAESLVYRMVAFVTASVIAGLAGGLFSLWTMSATPSMTSAIMTINALIMTILGGIGTLTGPLLGAGLMQVFSQFFYQWFGPRWPLVFGLIFILLVLFLPYGIIGTWRQKSGDLKAARQRLWGMLFGGKGMRKE
jgi:ABC-type branched-subunit amino acid transport system permease subunit